MIPEYYWIKMADGLYILCLALSIYVVGTLVMKYIEGIWRAKNQNGELQPQQRTK